MTNEEAIEILDFLSAEYYPNASEEEALEMAIKTLEQEPCDDCISREKAIRIAEQGQIQGFEWQIRKLCTLSPVKPKYTDEEIQKMQDLEQAQLEKAYELGKAETQTSFEDWLSTFNTDSATECFTAVQELKKRLESDTDA